MFVLGLFSIATAVGKNAQTIFITRFFAGVFGSSPVSNVAAALGDIWEPKARGIATTFYAIGEYTSSSLYRKVQLTSPSCCRRSNLRTCDRSHLDS